MLGDLQYCLRNGVGGRSKWLLGLICAHTSRPWLQWFTRPLIASLQEPSGWIGATCRAKASGQPVHCGFRLNELPSDKQTFIEMLGRDSYAVADGLSYDVVIDAGANGGLFSILANQLWPAAQVVLFEPSPTNQSFLDEHLRRNAARVEKRGTCLGNRQGFVPFYIRESNRCSVEQSDGHSAVVNVPMERLSDRAGPWRDQSVLLKLDVEGAELEVLEDFLPVAPARLRIVGELHDKAKRQAPFEALMRRFGYSYRYLDDSGGCLAFSAEPATSGKGKA